MTTEQVGRPCPSYVVTPDGKRYCEQGSDGHPGVTCHGARTEAEYLRLLAKAEKAEARQSRAGSARTKDWVMSPWSTSRKGSA